MTSLLQRRLLVGAVLILLVVWAKFNIGKFPYNGTWVTYSYFRDQEFARVSLSFNANNSCSWQADTYIKGRFSVTNFPCSYKMQGDVAHVEVRSYDNQVYQGKWRVAQTAAEKARAPLIMMTVPVTVTPQQNGALLSTQSSKTEFTYQGTDTTWSDSQARTMIFQKVRDQN